MYNEQRKHPRLSLSNLKAHVSIDRPNNDPIEFDGDVVDISYTGIKIRLTSPLPEESEGIVKIIVQLPLSKIPIAIQGEIKHYCPHFEYGVYHGNYSTEEALDELMFECVKQSKMKVPTPEI